MPRGIPWARQRLIRPADPQDLLGNAAKAMRLLGWSPTLPFEQMIREMTAADLTDLRRQPREPEKPERPSGREMPID